MKANEAPTKLYVNTNDHLTRNGFYAFTENNRKDSVEYIRKDAFIDKACSGIEKLLSGYIIRNFHFGDSYDIDRLIEDFRNYIKGE